MRIVLENILILRTQKINKNDNLFDCTNFQSPVESATILENLDETLIKEYVALFAYIIKIQTEIIITEREKFSDKQLENFKTFNAINNFDDYIDGCKNLIYKILEKGENIYERYKYQKGQEMETGENQEFERDDDLSTINEIMKNMNKLFGQFYEILTNEKNFPREIIFDKIFKSNCLSERLIIKLDNEAFDSIETLFSVLSSIIIRTTESCNSAFEAFFGPGIFFTALLNIVSEKVLSPKENRENSITDIWTRLRIKNEEDIKSAHFIKNINCENYQKTISILSTEIFNPISDIYLSKGDTMCSLFIQFLGRIFLRLYEWPERIDVKKHLEKYLICDNIHSLFLSTGRNQQQNWIRFFKVKKDNSKKIMVKIEPLISLNDELIFNSKKDSCRNSNIANGTNGTIKLNVSSADTIRRYNQLQEFRQKYDKFMNNGNNILQNLWNYFRNNFIERCGMKNMEEKNLQKYIKNENLSINNFQKWCEEINQNIFPYNFLMISSLYKDNGNTIDDRQLMECWIYKCQEYLITKHINSAKCTQILDFLRTIEMKSRLITEESNFKFIFGNAMEKMSFIYDLFEEINFDEQKGTKENEKMDID